MILRKPYALLIKNFKKIHLVMGILMAYIAYESSNILTFIDAYISTGTFTRTSFSLSSTYINIYMFLVSVLVAAIALIIYVLMRQKSKPKLLYFIIIGFYLGLVIFFFQIYNTLDVIEISTISPRSIRIIRDITSIVCYSQYAMILLMAIRAVGFNIKKFNFGEDLAELEIEVSDNEEFELTVGVDPDKIERRLRRGRRELKYFIVENFFVLVLILLILSVFTGIAIFLNKEVYNKIYAQNQSFKATYFVNKINNVYYTHLNQRGISIAPPGKLFVVANVTFNNKDIYPRQLNLDDINLTSGKDVFSPIITRYQSFSDLGTGYTNQIVEAGKAGTFIFVFEVDEKANFNELIFRYRESIGITSARLESKYKKVQLNGITIDTIKKISEVKTGEDLTFVESVLGDTKLKVKEMEIDSQFAYDASTCFNSTCTTVKTILSFQYTAKLLMRLSFDFNKGTNTVISNINSLVNLTDSFGYIRYVVGKKTYNGELINKTPTNYKGNDLYYQVPSNINAATSSELVFRIRDKEYVYKLK